MIFGEPGPHSVIGFSNGDIKKQKRREST